MKRLKFNKEMQLAIDEGRKTQTRRYIDVANDFRFHGQIERGGDVYFRFGTNPTKMDANSFGSLIMCPYGKIGDINNGCLITDIRVERLQSITKEDAHAEGVSNTLNGWPDAHDIMQFEKLWLSIHQNHPTKNQKANPLVWVITFEKV